MTPMQTDIFVGISQPLGYDKLIQVWLQSYFSDQDALF